jgi:hypothetical protein
LNDTDGSSASTFDWYPRSMKEFKTLPKEKKTEFLKKLKIASMRKSREGSISSSSTTASSANDQLTEKIINAIDNNVRKTIHEELLKIKTVNANPVNDKENIVPRSKSQRGVVTEPSTKEKLRLDDIENEIVKYKEQEQIVDKVEAEKNSVKKNCAFMVSFSAQAEEQNIDSEIRALYTRREEGVEDLMMRNHQGTQTVQAPVKRPNAWYCPIFTDRKVPIDRNALDSTKRLARNAWEKASLQEAVLIHKQEFISKSRARVRHVKLRREQRIIEKELEDERRKLFGTYSERQRYAHIHPLADKFHLGEKRQINLKEARKETTKRYNKLPEVVNARKHEKYNREKVENQIKVKCYNRKIQSKVLSKL